VGDSQDGQAYHCFCSPEALQETRKRLQKQGSHSTYDRKCLGLDKGETDRLVASGAKSVVRFKVSYSSRLNSTRPQPANTVLD